MNTKSQNQFSTIIQIIENILSYKEKCEEVSDEFLADIVSSCFVDKQWYAEKYKNVRDSDIDPAMHYVKYGYKDNYIASPLLEQSGINEITASMPLVLYDNFFDFLEDLIAIIRAKHLDTSPISGAENMRVTDFSRNKIEVVRQGSRDVLYDMPLWVDWYITHMCNYKCSYCSVDADRLDKSKFTSFICMINALDNLRALNRPSYNFSLVGGEPTVYPQILELIYLINSKFGKKVALLTLVTNGSRNLDFFGKLAELSGEIPLNLVISLHPEFCNSEHILDIIKSHSGIFPIAAHIMFHPEKTGICKKMFANLLKLREDYYFSLEIAPLYGPPSFTTLDERYTQDMLEWRNKAKYDFHHVALSSPARAPANSPRFFKIFHDISKNGKMFHLENTDRGKMFLQGFYNMKNMYCVQNTAKMNILENGDVRGAMFCRGSVTPYNVYRRNEFSDGSFIKIIKCQEKNCACNGNDTIMKFRSLDEARDFYDMAIMKQNYLLSNNI